MGICFSSYPNRFGLVVQGPGEKTDAAALAMEWKEKGKKLSSQLSLVPNGTNPPVACWTLILFEPALPFTTLKDSLPPEPPLFFFAGLTFLHKPLNWISPIFTGSCLTVSLQQGCPVTRRVGFVYSCICFGLWQCVIHRPLDRLAWFVRTLILG